MKRANTMDNNMKDNNGAAISDIEVRTPAREIGERSCTGIDSSDPSTLVIVGATGDLTARKLVPALSIYI
jgi:hypothetical protein